MADKYFVTQVQRKNGEYSKGCVIKNTLDEAKQTYHAYLGAYGYGHDPTVDFVACSIMDSEGYVHLVEIDDRRPGTEVNDE